jgi:hypothetical protein
MVVMPVADVKLLATAVAVRANSILSMTIKLPDTIENESDASS